MHRKRSRKRGWETAFGNLAVDHVAQVQVHQHWTSFFILHCRQLGTSRAIDLIIRLHMTPTATKKFLPNWALGALLGGLVVGTYIYSIKAVGDDSAEVVPTLCYMFKLNFAKKAGLRSFLACFLS